MSGGVGRELCRAGSKAGDRPPAGCVGGGGNKPDGPGFKGAPTAGDTGDAWAWHEFFLHQSCVFLEVR
jgi:hypothetical protein